MYLIFLLFLSKVRTFLNPQIFLICISGNVLLVGMTKEDHFINPLVDLIISPRLKVNRNETSSSISMRHWLIICFGFGLCWLFFFFLNILLSINKRRWQQNHNASSSFAIFATFFFFFQIHLPQILHNQRLKGPILNQTLLRFLLTSRTYPNLGF